MTPSLLCPCTSDKWLPPFKVGNEILPVFVCWGGEKMKKVLLFFPLLFVTLACSMNVTTITPTAISPDATITPAPEDNLPPLGTVTGKLSYPSEFIPPLRVVLFSLTDGKAYYVDTAKDQGTYSIAVPVGTYTVVSYPYAGSPGSTGVADSYLPNGGAFAGGYTQMVPCGLNVSCTDHSLIAVTVEAGGTVTADPGDWYAPEGTFPPMPNP